MKHLLLGLLAAAGILAVSTLSARADDGYWVPAPSAPTASAPSSSYDYPPVASTPYYPSAPYYAGPPPYYYGPPPGYYGAGYYGPRPGVHIFLPGLFFGFGFGGHHHR